MGAAVKAATKIQIGKEATRGTAVAATRRLIGEGRYRRLETFFPFEDQDFGVLARTSKSPHLVRNMTEFEYRGPLSFEEILLPLLSGMRGGVTPVDQGINGVNGRLWTFTPSTTADPAPTTHTLEFVESDFADNAEMEAPFMICTELEISGGVEALPEMRAEFMARKTVDSTLTAGVAVPALTYAANLLWSIYFDATFAGLGTIQKLGQVYGFRWIFRDFVFPQYYLDGRSDLDFSQYQFRKRTADLELDVVSNAEAAGLVQTEEANKTNGTLRFVQLKLLGAAIGAGSHVVKLNGAYYHADDSIQERGTDRDGNLITRMHLLSAHDPTSTNDVEVIVQNTLTAFP